MPLFLTQLVDLRVYIAEFTNVSMGLWLFLNAVSETNVKIFLKNPERIDWLDRFRKNFYNYPLDLSEDENTLLPIKMVPLNIKKLIK